MLTKSNQLSEVRNILLGQKVPNRKNNYPQDDFQVLHQTTNNIFAIGENDSGVTPGISNYGN